MCDRVGKNFRSHDRKAIFKKDRCGIMRNDGLINIAWQGKVFFTQLKCRIVGHSLETATGVCIAIGLYEISGAYRPVLGVVHVIAPLGIVIGIVPPSTLCAGL